jgi:hypothetical protein
MELLILFAIVVIAFQLGKHYGYYKIVKLMKEVAEEQGLDLERELGIIKAREEQNQADTVHKLQVEQHGDLLYLFDKESDSFICQGSSVQELCDLAKKQKNVNLAAVLHGDKVFAFKDGISTEVKA